ncbi:MAG: hypothetical protein WKF84_03650 [Pyrinomonadaceae bacterium]
MKLPPTATEPAPPVLFSPATAVTARRAWRASNVEGGLAIIQEPLTAQARVMPEAALALAPDADMIFSLQQISVFLSEICSQGVS